MSAQADIRPSSGGGVAFTGRTFPPRTLVIMASGVSDRPGGSTSRVIVSISGIRRDTCGAAADFAEELDRRGVPLSLLVAPRLKDHYRLVNDRETRDWLCARRDRGDAIVLHGYDQAATKRRRAEFAALGAHEARLRLLAADRVLEDIGLRSRIFAAPRWIAAPAAVDVLPDVGFRVYAGLSGVTDLRSGATERGRVLGFGDGLGTGALGTGSLAGALGTGALATGATAAEPWRCRALLMAVNRTARRGGRIRLSVAAHHLDRRSRRAALLDALDLALLQGAVGDVYREFRAADGRAA